MAVRVAISRIVIGRGKLEPQIIEPGEAFDFSPAQLKELEAHQPPILRLPDEDRVARQAMAAAPADDDDGIDDGEREPIADDDETEDHPAAPRRSTRRTRKPAEDDGEL